MCQGLPGLLCCSGDVLLCIGMAVLDSATPVLHQQRLHGAALKGRNCLSVGDTLICRTPVMSLPELAQQCLHAQWMLDIPFWNWVWPAYR